MELPTPQAEPTPPTPPILIVVATKVEATAILKVFSTKPHQARQVIGNKIYYTLGIHSGTPIFMVQSETGNATPGGALLTVYQAIQDLHPWAVILCGVAYGLNPNKQKLGDILIAKQLEYYEPQKTDIKHGKIPRGDRITTSEHLLDHFRSADLDWNGASTHFGLVLSGEKLVNDPAFRDWLIETEPEAIGGEMEGAGLYTATRSAKVDWILIKAICDWADGEKNDDAQVLAANNAAQFLLHVLQLGKWNDKMPKELDIADHSLNTAKLQPLRDSGDLELNESAPQDSLENPAIKYFVGRDKERRVFSVLLDNPMAVKRTLLIQGSGGQGKTWLIKNLLDFASRDKKILALIPDHLIDMYSTSNRHLEGMWNTLADQIKGLFKEDVFECYRQAQQDLETSRKQEDYSEEALNYKVKALGDAFRNCLLTLAQKQTIVLAFDTFENVQNSEVGDWILSNDGLQMPNLICLIGTRMKLSPEQRKEYTAVQEFELEGMSDEEAIKFYCRCTNFTGVSDKHKEFIIELNQRAGRNPLLLGLAIFWLDLPSNTPEVLRKLSPEQFEQEIVGWLSPRRGAGSVLIFRYNEQMRQALVFMAYLNRRFNFFFLEKLVMAGYINMDGVSARDLWDEFEKRKSDFFYVKERPDDEIQLHDKLAEMLRKYVLDEVFTDGTGQRLRQFMDEVVEWYDDLIQTTENKEILYAEQLAYLLRSDLYSDCQQSQSRPKICYKLPAYAPQPKKVIGILEVHRRRRSDVLARLILNEIKLPLIGQFDDASQYKIFKLLGQIAQQSYLHPIAQIHWQKAFESAERSANFDRQVEALVGWHNSTFQTDPQQSLKLLTQAHQICEDHQVTKRFPTVLYEIGFTYRHIYDLELSTKWYEMAKKQAAILEDREILPILLNDEGYNYLLMGDIARARTLIRTACDLRLREYNDLKEKRDGPEGAAFEDKFYDVALMLGLSYNTLGDLACFSGRLDEATRRYSEALELFQEAHSSYWQTRMYFSRGESYRRRAVAAYQAGRLDTSNEFEQKANSDIELGFNFCQQLGYVPESITAIRQMGRLYHDQVFRTSDVVKKIKYLKMARDQFEQALQIAQIHNVILEILENLTEIAFLGDDNMTISKQYFSQELEAQRQLAAQDIQNFQDYIVGLPEKEHIYQFSVFPYLLELEQAAYCFVLGDYSESFGLYLEAYKGLAQQRGYGVARYLQHLDHLVRQLRALLTQDRGLCMKWCQDFLDAWQADGLTEKRPELPQEIEMFMDTVFLYLND